MDLKSEERSVRVARRQVEHDRTVLRVEKHHEVQRIGVGRECLILRVEWSPPIDDLAYLTGRLGQHLLKHQVVVHRRHAPDDGFKGTAVKISLGELGRCER